MSIDEQIYTAALKAGFTPSAAKLIVAQARHETGNYTSYQYRTNNNLFGMKFVNQPLATKGNKSPEGDFYAKYPNVAASVQDLVNRNYKISRGGVSFDDLKKVSDTTDFAQKLKKRGYYTASVKGYDRGLKSALTRINIIDLVKKNKGKLSIGLALVVLAAYLYYKKR